MNRLPVTAFSLVFTCVAYGQVEYRGPHNRSVSGEARSAVDACQVSFFESAPPPAFSDWSWGTNISCNIGDFSVGTGATQDSFFRPFWFGLFGDAGVSAAREPVGAYANASNTVIFQFRTSGYTQPNAPAVRMWVGGGIAGGESGGELDFEFKITQLLPFGEQVVRARFVYPFSPPIGESDGGNGYLVDFGPFGQFGPAKLRLPPGDYSVEMIPTATINQAYTSAGAFYSIEAWFETITCDADFNGDGSVDFFDMLDFVAAASDAEPTPWFQGWNTANDADIDGNGVVEFFDYLDFVEKFNQGC
jgi:hypothetical protein